MLGVHVNQSMPTKLKCNAIITMYCKRRNTNEISLFSALRQWLPRRRPSREQERENEGKRCRKRNENEENYDEEVSDVTDIDQIMKVFLARSIPIDGRVCARLHISRLRCNFSPLPIRKSLWENVFWRRPCLATNAEYWVCHNLENEWETKIFHTFRTMERHTFIIERVANGNSTEQNLISFRFVAFEWNVRLRHTNATQNQLNSKHYIWQPVVSIFLQRRRRRWCWWRFATTTVFDGHTRCGFLSIVS